MNRRPRQGACKSDIDRFVLYDPEAGTFTRLAKANVRGKGRIGDLVGSMHSGGYLEMQIDGRRMFGHQAAWLLMTGEWPTFQIDHINGDRSDNRWSNLRRSTQQQNSANMKRRSNNKSGYKGVVRTPNGKWAAFIHVKRKTHALGTYDCPRVAHRAYIMASRFAWGNYARAE